MLAIDGQSVTVSGLTIRNGEAAEGGAIANRGIPARRSHRPTLRRNGSGD